MFLKDNHYLFRFPWDATHEVAASQNIHDTCLRNSEPTSCLVYFTCVYNNALYICFLIFHIWRFKRSLNLIIPIFYLSPIYTCLSSLIMSCLILAVAFLVV